MSTRDSLKACVVLTLPLIVAGALGRTGTGAQTERAPRVAPLDANGASTHAAEPSSEAASSPRADVERPFARMSWFGPTGKRWRAPEDPDHLGWDIPGREGEDVLAMADGFVHTHGSTIGCRACAESVEDYVFIEHERADGTVFVALYSNIEISVDMETRVRAGQVIGKVASDECGQDEWSYLHLGVWDGSDYPAWDIVSGTPRRYVDPEDFLHEVHNARTP